MNQWKGITASLLAATLVVLPAAVAGKHHPTAQNEAPTGFDTPTLSDNPGSQSHGNGLVDDVTFGGTQANFEEEEGIDKGLGPLLTLGRVPTVIRTRSRVEAARWRSFGWAIWITVETS